ncbi:hypothetical protein cyc_05814 [Cyclospora cayetanensis]|uniref:Uncharacterized protein n=1 Tax=Cyclospora cayetanensis TaxID=88456 RepID=A0A1D3D730_9EIME|nr:hypothetical protein cyc_05814 [Cyclospora cayetanensis]
MPHGGGARSRRQAAHRQERGDQGRGVYGRGPLPSNPESARKQQARAQVAERRTHTEDDAAPASAPEALAQKPPSGNADAVPEGLGVLHAPLKEHLRRGQQERNNQLSRHSTLEDFPCRDSKDQAAATGASAAAAAPETPASTAAAAPAAVRRASESSPHSLLEHRTATSEPRTAACAEDVQGPLASPRYVPPLHWPPSEGPPPSSAPPPPSDVWAISAEHAVAAEAARAFISSSGDPCVQASSLVLRGAGVSGGGGAKRRLAGACTGGAKLQYQEGLAQKSALLPTGHIWGIVLSVLLTWLQDPLLSLLASAAAARLKEGAPLAVVAVGAGGQVPDGLCLLLAALGLAVGALCSRAGGRHARGKDALASTVKGVDAEGAYEGREGRRQAVALAPALRVAAVGAWIATGVGVMLAAAVYAGSASILSFFLSIRGVGAAAGSPAADEMRLQQETLSLAVEVLRLRCVSLPSCLVALTAKAALLTLRDPSPQIATLASAAVAAPLFFMYAARGAATAAAAPLEAARAFVSAAALTVVAVQVASAAALLVRLGTLAAASSPSHQQKEYHRMHGFLQRLQTVWQLYRPPLPSEVLPFAPFVLPVLTQCCVRLVLYSSMTKAASLQGPKAMAAHQLVSGLYTVLGMPADTMAQVVNAAAAQGASGALRGPTSYRRLQRRIFKVSAVTAILSAATQLALVLFLSCRLSATDFELSRAVFYAGACAAVPLLLLPFCSSLEGLLLLKLQTPTVAAAYAATLPPPLLVMIAAEKGGGEAMRSLNLNTPCFVSCLWVLPLVYNVIKILVMALTTHRAGGRLAIIAKEPPV